MNSLMGNNKPPGNIDKKIDYLTKSAHEISDIIIRFMEDPEVRNTLEVQHPGITPDRLRGTVMADLEQMEKDAGNKTEHYNMLFKYNQKLDDIRYDAVRVRFPDVEYASFTMGPNAGNYGMTAKGGARKTKSSHRKHHRKSKSIHRKTKSRKTKRRY